MGLALRAWLFRLAFCVACACVFGVLAAAVDCWALEPQEVLVVANRDVSASVDLANYYMQRRGIPGKNLLGLSLPEKEAVEGGIYDSQIAAAVRKYLNDKDPFRFIKCIVTMYGVPLKISRPKLDPEKMEELKALKTQRAKVDVLIKDAGDADREKARDLRRELDDLRQRIVALERQDRGSSVDSELALVLEESYPFDGWIPNPVFLGFRGKKMEGMPRHVLMVARLDGPTPAIVRRIIDDALFAEKDGLRGKAYFDARWPEPSEPQTSGYRLYDQSIHRSAKLIEEKKFMPVVLDDKPGLFQAGQCPAAALYCGWYSLAKYIDAFDWAQGAVGYHIASAECKTLREPDSRVWCKMMLEDGVAATLGPVGEPYVEAFPLPELFFSLLMEERLTLAECYAASNPFWSWKMVLIGDPLYKPHFQ